MAKEHPNSVAEFPVRVPDALAESTPPSSILQEMTDWGQCSVLELAAYYTPANEAEVYDILNALEDRMSHVNSAVVLAAMKVFLHMTLNMTATHQQVSGREHASLSKCQPSWDTPASVWPCIIAGLCMSRPCCERRFLHQVSQLS